MPKEKPRKKRTVEQIEDELRYEKAFRIINEFIINIYIALQEKIEDHDKRVKWEPFAEGDHPEIGGHTRQRHGNARIVWRYVRKNRPKLTKRECATATLEIIDDTSSIALHVSNMPDGEYQVELKHTPQFREKLHSELVTLLQQKEKVEYVVHKQLVPCIDLMIDAFLLKERD
jgi:hypothetical protein